MPSITKSPGTVTQVTADSTHTSWQNLANVKSTNSTYARTNIITGVKGKHPKIKILKATNFQFNLPAAAEVTKIIVSYSYRKAAKKTNKYPSIAGPKIMLSSSGLDELYRYAKDGTTPGKDFPTKNWSRTWDGKYTQEVIVAGSTMTGSMSGTIVDNKKSAGAAPTIITSESKTKTITSTYTMPSVATVNNASFGIAFHFPKNTSENEGYIDFKTVTMTVYYKMPSYGLSLTKLGTEEIVKDKAVTVNATITNKELTAYSPTLQISTPEDMELTITNINLGSFKQISSGLYEWKPLINKQVGSVTLELELIPHTAGTNNIRLVELLNNTSTLLSLDVQQQATGIVDEEIDSEQVLYAIQNTQFEIPVKVPLTILDTVSNIYIHSDKAITINSTSVSANGYYIIPKSSFDENGFVTLTASTATTGILNLGVDPTTKPPEVPTFIVKIVPEGLTVPKLSILQLSDEELNRLGDGINYEITTNLQITCDASSIQFFEDYYRNFRVGVVNNTDSTDKSTIFNACKEWSSGLTAFNEFERKTVTFQYDENYPVYIIISGNYNCNYCPLFNIEFTDIEVKETEREDILSEVLFPTPIREMVSTEEGHVANLNLPKSLTGNSLIFYDFELPDEFKDKDNLAIRGVGVKVNCSTDSTVIMSAKLKSKGLTGERSSIISTMNNTWTLGGHADRWGFTVSDLKDIKNFSVELSFSNVSIETLDEVNIAIEDIQLIIYYSFYEESIVECFIDGENLASYNVFLDKVEIPEGLETDTKYLTVEGTDTNDAYRQNIKQKEITLEFSIDECTFEEATETLQDVTELLVNERDVLNTPIPKVIQFSHYPNIYWEYVMEDAIDVNPTAASYECKVKLTIPAGTAFTIDDVTTGKTGTVKGIAKVNPIIRVTPTSQHIELEETLTNQKFMMTYNDWSAADVIEIDCEDRIVTLHQNEEEIDITPYTDFNSNWFILHKNFIFEETNCIIQSVTWTERR